MDGPGVDPRVSMRLVLPCVRALRGHPAIPRALLARLEAIDADARLPAAAMIDLLSGAVALTGELGTESSPLTSTGTTSYIRTAVPIGCNHNGTLLRASGVKSKQPRKAARRARSVSA